MSRFVLMVLDGVGVGALPDADAYGDAGSDTLGNLSRVVDLRLPFLEKLGLGTIIPVRGVPPVDAPLALTGRLATLSAGKDTTIGHWEHMGLVTERPFPTYPHGFPEEVLSPFRERIGRGVLGNKTASGTVVIEELGAEHMASGWPIVYTSADSVFQIAAHVGRGPPGAAVRMVRHRPRDPAGAARGGAGHRPAVHRDSGGVHAHEGPAGLLVGSARSDIPRPAPRGRGTCSGSGEDQRGVHGTGHQRDGEGGLQRRQPCSGT